MAERIYIFKGFERFWHWAQAALIITLLITGFEIHGTYKLFGFYKALDTHTTAAWALIGLWIFAIFWHVTTGEWRHYIPTTDKVLVVANYYASGIFRGEPHPHEPSKEEHFNALQAVTYWSVMYLLLPVILVSGLIYLYPEFAPDTVFGFDGLLPIALTHYLAAVALLLFLLSHIYLGTTGKTVGQMFRMMITGWHEH